MTLCLRIDSITTYVIVLILKYTFFFLIAPYLVFLRYAFRRAGGGYEFLHKQLTLASPAIAILVNALSDFSKLSPISILVVGVIIVGSGNENHVVPIILNLIEVHQTIIHTFVEIHVVRNSITVWDRGSGR